MIVCEILRKEYKVLIGIRRKEVYNAKRFDVIHKLAERILLNRMYFFAILPLFIDSYRKV